MGQQTTILYVDDEQLNLMLLKYNLQKKYTVLTALSGFDGLEMLQANPGIRIVLSDMKMPGMNGLEFIKQAKREFPEVVFFILTGFDITPEIEAALESGLIKKYHSKPFVLSEIENSIQGVINSAG